VRQALESERMQKLAVAFDAACSRLNALLETISHESQVDDAAPLPPNEVITMTNLLAEPIDPPADESDDQGDADEERKADLGALLDSE